MNISEAFKDKYTEGKLKKIWHTNYPKHYIDYYKLKPTEFVFGKKRYLCYDKKDVDFVSSELKKYNSRNVKVLFDKENNSLESKGLISFKNIGKKLNLARQTITKYVDYFQIPYDEIVDPIGHVLVKVLTLDNFEKLKYLLSLDENKNMKKILSHKKKIELHGSLENAENKRVKKMLKTRSEWSDERKQEFNIKCIENLKKIYSDENMKKEIMNKTKNTRIKKYGSWENYSNTMRNNQNKTLIKKYGSLKKANEVKFENKIKNLNEKGISKDEFYKQVFTKMLKTCSEKYGDGKEIKNISQLSVWRDKVEDYWENLSREELNNFVQKCKNTCISRYGKDNAFSFAVSGKYHYDNLIFDSKWEIYFYQYLKDNNIPFEYHTNDLIFDYIYNGIECKYHADFKVNDIIYEIKGDHFFNDKGELINPFDSSDKKPLAKQQCMKENNVVILKAKEIKKYEEWFKEYHKDVILEKYRGNNE